MAVIQIPSDTGTAGAGPIGTGIDGSDPSGTGTAGAGPTGTGIDGSDPSGTGTAGAGTTGTSTAINGTTVVAPQPYGGFSLIILLVQPPS